MQNAKAQTVVRLRNYGTLRADLKSSLKSVGHGIPHAQDRACARTLARHRQTRSPTPVQLATLWASLGSSTNATGEPPRPDPDVLWGTFSIQTQR